MEQPIRPRRLRKTPVIRKMIRETRVSPSSLIYPLFVREGRNIIEDIPSLEGQKRYSPDTLPFALELNGTLNALKKHVTAADGQNSVQNREESRGESGRILLETTIDYSRAVL